MPQDPEREKSQLHRLRNKLNKLERFVAQDYPQPEHISYIARIGVRRAFFLTQDRYSYDWFYGRGHPNKLHEPALSHSLFHSLSRNSVFVDVGANLGYFSIIAALRARAVFAIEPQEFLISRIHANAAANHLDNVTLIHAAAGAKPGFVNIPKVGTPATHVGESENRVLMIRLDDYFAQEWQPTHLKIDTEGFEHHVLLGAQKLLAAQPTLYIEYHRNMREFGHGGEEMWDLLKDLGYKITAAAHRVKSDEFVEIARADLQNHEGQMLFCQPAQARSIPE